MSSFSGVVTSHLPSCEPPQGPFMRLLEQRTTGQMPPVSPSTQSPQAPQRSYQTACSCGMPSMLVLTAGSTSFGGELLGHALDADAAGHAEHHRVLVDLGGDGVQVLPLALADGGGVLDLHLAAVFLGLDAQLGGQDLGLLLASGETDRDAGVAAGHQDLLAGPRRACRISSKGLRSAVIMRTVLPCWRASPGLGPRRLMRSVNSVATSAKRGPMADDMLYISMRSGSMPISASSVLA